jgi:ATP-dependent RNA helicase DDX24/MAK5
VYSATLTLPTSTHHLIKKDPSKKFSKKNKKGYRQPSTVDGAIAEMLELAGAMGETKVVDLSNLIPEGMSQQSKKAAKDKKSEKDTVSSKSSGDAKKPSSVAARLPPGLTLGEIRCAQRHKDSHLYAYLVTTHQGSSGPCLVFCNSIAAVRRVGETLQTLGLPVKMLHAQMAQVSVFFAAYLVTHTQRL